MSSGNNPRAGVRRAGRFYWRSLFDWSFSGRCSREAFVLFTGFHVCVVAVLLLADRSFGWIGEFGRVGYLSGAFCVLTIPPAWAISVRRLHDAGMSGSWLLLPGLSIGFVFFRGDRGPNRYGPDPRGRDPLDQSHVSSVIGR